MSDLKELLQGQLSEKIKNVFPLSGGDINMVYKVITEKNSYVLKVNQNRLFPKMFEKEKQGLSLLANSGVKTPEIIFSLTIKGYQYLLLEYIEEEPVRDLFWKNFAINLVKIHKSTSNYYGLKYSNYIGSLIQINKETNSWTNFFITNRILPLMEKAYDRNLLNKFHLKSFENLFIRLNEILPKENPSLVHGDLWSGNLMRGLNQTPIFIDPAVYFGNREMDIAMTQLFGGFDNFYLSVYNEIFPLEKGWKSRLEIHNLYPNLVHLILFGNTYLNSIEKVIKKYN